MIRGRLAALAATTLLVTFVAPPAHAVEAFELIGGFEYIPGCSVCHPYGTGRFWAIGTRTGPVDVTYTYNEGSVDIECLLQGTMTGAINAPFTLVRYGDVLLGNTYGDPYASLIGVAILPVGVSCSGTSPVDITATLTGVDL